ncbi:PrgI family mobile element protein [Ruminococcus sp.]|uniref:PrgI family mobile element protein n=1 Tax=Ruminococcus sp. TaxID=41978 RepID=UPI0025E0DD30|nr:PrgI family protein [Ruminococcus sp.]MBQ6252473.1 PrgI family protein [Ruminococcus sp.]
MIKAKITKNIMKKTNNSLGLTPKQMIITGIAFAIGLLMYFLLKNHMNFTLLSTLIFIELAAVICFGVINMQGMSLFEYFVKTMKGVDVRYYKQEGVYMNNVDIQKEEKH